jgi:hypothetical protein
MTEAWVVQQYVDAGRPQVYSRRARTGEPMRRPSPLENVRGRPMSEAWIVEQYLQHGRSTHSIAAELGAYPNKIVRTLKRLGFRLRDRSAAQKLALASGRHPHPRRRRNCHAVAGAE